jgi:hypothetical protein
MPKNLQVKFTGNVVNCGLNKNQVENLVSCYLNKNTPKSTLEEILNDPVNALKTINEFKTRRSRIKNKKDNITIKINVLKYTNNHIKQSIDILKELNKCDNKIIREHLTDLFDKCKILIDLIQNLIGN